MAVRRLAAAILLVAALLVPAAARAEAASTDASDRAAAALHGWYDLVLELVRHTPTYPPPVASRAFGYLGVAAWEATASGDARLVSLAGQLNGLAPLPPRTVGTPHDEAVVLEAALAASVRALFGNTGLTGQRAIDLFGARLQAAAAAGLDPALVARSAAHGEALARHVLDWAAGDGGAVVENMGFPHDLAGGLGPDQPVRPTAAAAPALLGR